MKKFSAVIFDMDGVIVDSEPRHVRAFREVFDAMGYGERHGMDFEAYLGRSDRALWLDFVAKHQPKQSLEELTAWKQRRLIEILRAEEPIFEGLPDLVAKVAVGHKLAVASGSMHTVIEAVLELKNLRRFFSTVVSVQDVAHGKPAPDIFLRTAELLGVPASECCVIEDSAAGVQAGKAAGMTVIAITNSLPAARLAQADHVVATYEAIAELLGVAGGGRQW